MVEMVRDGVSNPRVLKAVGGTEQHQFMPSSPANGWFECGGSK